MTENERNDLAENMSAQAQKAQQIIADAEKNGYLPKVELSGADKWDIEERQTTFEERIALRTEERNKEYLEYRESFGKKYTNPQRFGFGNWSKENCDNYTLRAACNDKNLSREEQLENKKKLAQMTEEMTYLNTSHLQNTFDWKLHTTDIVHTDKGADSSYSPLAYNFGKQTLFINDTILKNAQNSGDKLFTEVGKGNPAALNCAMYHELNHKQNWENDGLGKLSYTPVNAAKGAVLTEKISLCTEYLTMAKEYNERKEKGDTTIKYTDGSEKPLDSLLEIYPGFKDTAEKYGTDISNPEVRREFIKAAMNYWKNDRSNDYVDQTKTEAQWGNKYFNQCSFSKQMELLKDEDETYKKVSEAMLKDINIGEQQISLTDCKDLIDTFRTEDAKKLIKEHNQKDDTHENPVYMPTYQEYQEINVYLESQGKKTDAEKMDHIAKTVKQASNSLTSYDKTLENIMLKHNPEITSGPLNIERTENQIIASIFDKKYDITEFGKPQNEGTKMAEPQFNMGQDIER